MPRTWPTWSPPPSDGDRAAFDELVRVTYADTYTLALRLTGNEEDARDVVQEAYLRAYRGLKRFRGRRPVLHVAVPDHRQLRLTHLGRRDQHRHDELDDDDAVVDDLRPDARPRRLAPTPAALRDRADRGALAALPPQLRAVVVLRDIYDLPHEAIAAELGHLRVGGQGAPAPGPPASSGERPLPRRRRRRGGRGTRRARAV